MNRRRDLSIESKKRIAEKIRLKPSSLDFFIKKSEKAKTYTEVDLQKLHLISDWYYFAILSLMETDDFQSDPKWIAKRLNITHSEASVALKTLASLGMIEKNSKDQYLLTGKIFQRRTTSPISQYLRAL